MFQNKVDIMKWWKSREDNSELPNWSQACKLVLLVQPSSAVANECFPCIFATARISLEDYIQLSIMLQYNYRKSHS